MAKKFTSGHPKPKKPGKPLGAPQKVGGTYRRSGSAYSWAHTKKGWQRIPGSARGGPGKAPYDPLQPLQGRSFGQEVKRNVDLRYGQPLQNLGNLQASVPGWYDQYRNTLAQLNAATQQNYAQQQQNVYNQANTASAQDTAQASKLQQESQQSAQMRGAQVDPQLAQQAAQAAASRTALSSSFGGMIGAQGAAQRSYGAATEGAALASKLTEQQRLNEQRQGLLTERGQYATQVRGDLRDKERTYALNRSAFGLKVQQQRDTARNQRGQLRNVRHGQNLIARDKRAKNRLKKLDQQIAQGNLDERQRHDLEQERQNLYKILHPSQGRGGGGGRGGSGLPPGITPTKARNNQNAFENTVQKHRGEKDFNKVYKNVLSMKKPPPPDLAEAIGLRAIGRFPSHKTARKLYRKYGVRMKSK